MEEGFIVDHAHAELRQSQWIEGPPQKSFGSGLKIGGKEHRKIATFCCPKCGFLESYAELEAL
jgi:hypothetical protein